MFDQAREGEWIQPTARFRAACCDCGLTHVLRFRIRHRQVQMMAYVDRQATRNLRRAMRREQARKARVK